MKRAFAFTTTLAAGALLILAIFVSVAGARPAEMTGGGGSATPPAQVWGARAPAQGIRGYGGRREYPDGHADKSDDDAHAYTHTHTHTYTHAHTQGHGARLPSLLAGDQ